MRSRNVGGEDDDPQRQHPEAENWQEAEYAADTQRAAQSHPQVAGAGQPDLETGKVGVVVLRFAGHALRHGG